MTRKDDTKEFLEWWAEKLSTTVSEVQTYYKKSKTSHVRRNDGALYRGVFRPQVKRSVDLNRKISAWTNLLSESLKA